MEFPPLHGMGEPLEKSILVVERNRIKMRQKKGKKKEKAHIGSKILLDGVTPKGNAKLKVFDGNWSQLWGLVGRRRKPKT